MKFPRSFYIPAGACKVADKASTAVAYLYARKDGVPCTVVFSGKRSKPDNSYRFRTEAERERFIVRHFEGVRAREGRVVANREERKAAERRMEVGHILRASWGYDQTNVDFYVVTALVGRTMVEVRKIGTIDAGTETSMSGYVLPNVEHVIGEPLRRRVGPYGGVRIDGVRHASIWEGRPAFTSSWH